MDDVTKEIVRAAMIAYPEMGYCQIDVDVMTWTYTTGIEGGTAYIYGWRTADDTRGPLFECNAPTLPALLAKLQAMRPDDG